MLCPNVTVRWTLKQNVLLSLQQDDTCCNLSNHMQLDADDVNELHSVDMAHTPDQPRDVHAMSCDGDDDDDADDQHTC